MDDETRDDEILEEQEQEGTAGDDNGGEAEGHSDIRTGFWITPHT